MQSSKHSNVTVTGSAEIATNFLIMTKFLNNIR